MLLSSFNWLSADSDANQYPEPTGARRMNNDVWERFEAMLLVQAPSLLATFRPPATEAQIAEAESAMGVQFPAEIRCAYLRHDGSNHRDGTQEGLFFPPFNWWACIADMLRDWQMKVELRNDAIREFDESFFPVADASWDELRIAPVWWNEKWIPIGLSGTSTSVYFDLDPAPKGTRGQLFLDDGMQEAFWCSNALIHYLEQLIALVENGKLVYRGGWVWTSTGELANDLNEVA